MKKTQKKTNQLKTDQNQHEKEPTTHRLTRYSQYLITRMSQCTVNNIVPEFSGTRVNDIGLYTSCLANKSQTYFMVVKPLIKPSLANISKTHKDQQFNSFFQHDNYFYGVCANADCLYSSVVETIDPVFDTIKQNYGEAKAIHAPSFMSQQHKTDFWVVSFTIAMISLLVFTILSTLINHFEKMRIAKKLRKARPSRLDSEILEEAEELTENKIWRHFDLIRNAKSIVNPSIKNVSAQAFNLARIMSMLFVIFGHELAVRYYYASDSLDNFDDFLEYVRTSPLMALPQMGLFSVSIFFFMGGFVASITIPSFIKKCREVGRSPISIFGYMALKRCARMFPPVLVISIFYSKVMRMLMSGPLYILALPKIECKNFRVWTDVTLAVGFNNCASWLWYIRCDIQLYILLTAIFFLVKSWNGRVIWTGSAMAVSIVLTTAVLVVGHMLYGVLGDASYYFNVYARMRMYMFGALVGLLFNGKKNDKKNKGKGAREGAGGGIKVVGRGKRIGLTTRFLKAVLE